ncbi:hypothetical protein [Micromonospora sp. B9E7]|uniref:hypothetical protein n=1 Tax=Micromonospora sp. B9E7 TaxID=3153574 RepID=UPI00325E5857
MVRPQSGTRWSASSCCTRDKLPVDGLLLVLYYPGEAGDNAEKLRLLASLAAS